MSGNSFGTLYRVTSFGESHGPAIGADQSPFPGGTTPIEGLVLCGAGVSPGIGVPPVAVSGAMAAHSFVPVSRHKALLDELGMRVPG